MIMIPSVDCARCFNSNARNTRKEDRIAIFLSLRIKDLEARHADDTGMDASFSEEFTSLHGEGDLSSGSAKNDIDGFVSLNDVCTVWKTSACSLGANTRWGALTREGKDGGTLTAFKGELPGSGGFVAIARTHDDDIRDSSEREQMLDGLMSWTILTVADAVVSELKDGGKTHQSGSTDCRTHVVRECEECGGIWTDVVGGETVHDLTHDVLTDTIVDVVALKVAASDIDTSACTGEVAGSEISTATDDKRRWDGLHEGFDDLL